MKKSWFEMSDIRQKQFNNSVWIPLYACQELERCGRIGYDGYKSEFFGCGTLAVPITQRKQAAKLGWDSIGIGYDSIPWVDESGKYFPSDTYTDFENNFIGLRLVLRQSMEQPEVDMLLLHQDLVLALGLKREGDTWVRPKEGYIEVVHLKRDNKGTPILIEIRAEHLKDYLRARKMLLRITSYRERIIITSLKPEFSLDSENTRKNINNHWEGYICEIHEGGQPFGARMAMFRISRNDVDFSEDIPIIGKENDKIQIRNFQQEVFLGKNATE